MKSLTGIEAIQLRLSSSEVRRPRWDLAGTRQLRPREKGE